MEIKTIMNNQKITEKLLKIFSDSAGPLQLKDIASKMQLKSTSKEYSQMRLALDGLIEQEIIEKSARRRYMLKDLAPQNTIKGIIHIENDRGIVMTDIPDIPRIVIKRTNFATALDGDEVRVNLFALRERKKPRGEVVEVLSRSKESIVGTIDYEDGFYFLIPSEERHYVDLLIHPDKTMSAKKGDKVAGKLLYWDDPNKLPVAEVTEIIGKSGKPLVEFETIVREFNLPDKFPLAVTKEANKIDIKISEAEIKRREDLRHLEIITIDPFDAKDFDDAISLEMLENGNFYLGVHIADVSYYVKDNSHIDKEALDRGNSVYLVDRVLPMLPETLSNNICSLRPNEDRLCYSVFMEISPRYALKDYKIVESVINSKRRFNYDEVQEIIDGADGDSKELITKLHSLASALRKKRLRQGLDLETVEVKFILDDNKYPVKAILKGSTPATNLIEECMLMANKTVAQHIANLSKTMRLSKKLPFLYRIHDLPNKEKLQNVIEISNLLGYKITSKRFEKKDMNSLLNSVNGKPEQFIINQMLLRSLAKAEYSNENIGHYGLGFKEYCHFTSPIRRYPDLIVHRLLKEYTSEKKFSAEKVKMLDSSLEKIGEHCTEMERVAQEAERASSKLTQSVMAKDHLGSEYDATISGITGFGLFAELDDIHSEGLVNMRDLRDDYYIYDEKKFRLLGRRFKKVFRIGKRIRVKIIRVDVEKRKIDLEYIKDLP